LRATANKIFLADISPTPHKIKTREFLFYEAWSKLWESLRARIERRIRSRLANLRNEPGSRANFCDGKNSTLDRFSLMRRRGVFPSTKIFRRKFLSGHRLAPNQACLGHT
jgi:hypothetical protein